MKAWHRSQYFGSFFLLESLYITKNKMIEMKEGENN
jgi:hypothetical protein